MKHTSTILLLSGFYSIAVIFFWLIKRTRPGMFSLEKIRRADLRMLSVINAFACLLLLSPLFLTHPLPSYFLQFPDRVGLWQSFAFFLCFGIMWFFPWKRFSKECDSPPTFRPLELTMYAATKVLYLAAYELFFRGSLLIAGSAAFGINVSIAINTVLYVIAHVHKEKKEIIGCIPFGLILCLFTFWWQSIWPAIILHVELALLTEWPVLKPYSSQPKQPAL